MGYLVLFCTISAVVGATIVHWRYGLFTITKISVIQVMFISHLLVQMVPSIVLAIDPSNSEAFTYAIYCALSAVLIPMGAALADVTLRGRKHGEFYITPVRNDLEFRKRFARFFIAYMLGCLLIFISYIVRVPSFPIRELLFGINDILGYQESRRSASTLGYAYGVALRFLMPILFLLGIMSRRYFTSRPLRSVGVLAVVVAITYNAWPGSKTPVATLFLMATILIVVRSSEASRLQTTEGSLPVVREQGKSQKRKVRLAIAISLAAILYPVGMFMLLPAGQLGLGYVFESVLLRIFFKPAENTYMAFELFKNENYTYFADIYRLSQLFDFKHISLSEEVASFRGLSGITNAPPASIGNFFAQGGGVVVIIGVIVAGFLFRMSEIVLRQQMIKTPLTIALYVALIFGAFRFSWGNFYNLIFSELFVPMACISVLWLISGRPLPWVASSVRSDRDSYVHE